MAVPKGTSLPLEPLCLVTQGEHSILPPNSSLESWAVGAGRKQSLQEDKPAAEDKYKGAALFPALGQKSYPHCI